jgi:hypothetical protein
MESDRLCSAASGTDRQFRDRHGATSGSNETVTARDRIKKPADQAGFSSRFQQLVELRSAYQ